jgi:2-oxoisovalerate dehydrogenase E1 component
MLDAAWARRPYPGDDYVLPFGRAKITMRGSDLTVVTWGAMVERAEEAARQIAAASGKTLDVVDLRTLMPWDRGAVLDSVRRTRRCLIVHEDLRSGGFGAEIGATIAEDAFMHLDAPVARLTMPDVPSPHNAVLLDAVVPSVAGIRARAEELLEF